MKNEKQLMEQIEHMRRTMIKIASEKGVTSPDSIQASQELDRLMNEVMLDPEKTQEQTSSDENINNDQDDNRSE